MRKIAGFLLLSFAIMAGEKVCFFFSPEKKVEIEGKVEKIEENQNFCKSSYFVVLSVKDKAGKLFKIYISPFWFFTERPDVGEEVKIKGAYSEDNRRLLIAEWIYFRGEKIFLRDERGFPLWSRRMRRSNLSRRRSGRRWEKR